MRSKKLDPIVGQNFRYVFDHRKYRGKVKAKMNASTYLISDEDGDRLITIQQMVALGFIFTN